MDPEAALRAILESLIDGDIEEARDRAGHLRHWLATGGFEPRLGAWFTRWLLNQLKEVK